MLRYTTCNTRIVEIGKCAETLIFPSNPTQPKKPKISVVMPTYNQSRFIRESIESLLSQTFTDFELIIVDDGSTDNTKEIIERYADPRIRYFYKSNGGTGSALNEGFRHAVGQYETWVASDNCMLPECLQTLQDFLDSRPDIEYVYANCDIHIMDPTGIIPVHIENLKIALPPASDGGGQEWSYAKLTQYYFLGICWMWRKQLHERIGEFSSELCEDYDFTLRCAEQGAKFHFLDKRLGWYRQHRFSTTAWIVSKQKNNEVHDSVIVRGKQRVFPRHCWCYWGEKTLPYLRYLTLETFCRQNPDWKITLYRPKYPCATKSWTSHEQKYHPTGEDWSNRLENLPIEIIDFDFQDIDISNDVSEVHKSDFLRLYLLSNFGGLWTDMDIIYFRPINLPLTHETYICNGHYGHSIGLLLSTPNSPVFSFLFEEAKKEFNKNEYQSIGATLFNKNDEQIKALDRTRRKMYPKSYDNVPYNIPMDAVYAYNAENIVEIYMPMTTSKFTERSIGLHWYGGHQLSGMFSNIVTNSNYKTLDNVLGKTIEASLNGDR